MTFYAGVTSYSNDKILALSQLYLRELTRPSFNFRGSGALDSCSPRSGGKMQKLTLLESVSSRSSEVINVRSETMYSRTLPLSSAD